jgi:3-oxoacyl-[acyl-carrier-protein] synthase-3
MLYCDPVLASQRNGRGFTHKTEGVRPYLRMEGRKVFGVACETMARDVRAVLDKYNAVADAPVAIEDVAYIYPHQANLRIIEAAAKRLGVPLDRVYTDGIARYGNTSAASIPIGYRDRRKEEGAAPGRYEVDVAFGAGFASGAILRQT